MNKVKFKTICIVLALGFSVLAKGQDSVTKQGISIEEKRKLEEKFKALKNFYIHDDGSVVYLYDDPSKKNNNDSTAIVIKQKAEEIKLNEPTRVKMKTSVEEKGEYGVESNEAVDVIEADEVLCKPTRVKVKVSVNEDGEYAVESNEADVINVIKSDMEDYVENNIDTIVIESNFIPENKSPQNDSIATTVNVKVTKIVEDYTEPVKATPKNKSVNTEIRFNSLEAARLATEENIERLKKQLHQKQTAAEGKSSSLKDKIAGSVDGKIIKQEYNLDDYLESQDSTINKLDIIDPHQFSEPGEPTYFINGVQVSKAEVKKLKPRDIIKKERRGSKTNSNGEEWIETRR